MSGFAESIKSKVADAKEDLKHLKERAKARAAPKEITTTADCGR